MEKFKLLLKQKKLKSTTQRALMLKAIEEAGHIDIDALREKMQEAAPSTSLNTIYLNLEQLSSEELISKVALNSQKSVYEITKDAHAHLVCRVCGGVEDMDINPKLLTAMKEGAEKMEFKPFFVAVNIYGVCAKCAEQPK